MQTEMPANAYIQLITSKDHIDWWQEVCSRNNFPLLLLFQSQVLFFTKDYVVGK